MNGPENGGIIVPNLYEMATEWSTKELKREYTRLRDKFQKQIGRLSKVDKSPRIQSFLPGGYKFQRTIKEVENLRGRQSWTEKAIREDWARRVAELQGLTEARSLSISGRKAIRRDTIEALQDMGYTNINNKNFDKFTSFMNFAKAQGVLKEYDSSSVADAFNDWLDGGVLSDSDIGDYIGEWNAAVESVDLFG